jgi:hypothetical protein
VKHLVALKTQAKAIFDFKPSDYAWLENAWFYRISRAAKRFRLA